MPTAKPQRQTVRRLITEGLGYCCPFIFFHRYKKTGLIALRLGVEERTVRYWKMAYRQGDLKCEKCQKCLKDKLL